jgi:glycosyltransferase involved in cell wall biosynthesis
MTPRVSVLIPTYNRSGVLWYAIESVLHQTVTDWELRVTGDGCTDDSAEVVASFNDPRIHWHNLPENSGSQGVPNAYGVAAARAPYIAHLGHDDLWYPTHLEHLLRAVEETGADFVNTLLANLGALGSGIRRLDGLIATEGGKINANLSPSCVLYRRALAEQVGSWKDYRETSFPPDKDLFHRMFTAGATRAVIEELTVFKFPASWRKNVYRENPSHEQTLYLKRMREEPDFLYREALAAAAAHAQHKTAPPDVKIQQQSRRGAEVEYRRQLRGLEARPLPKWTLAERAQAARAALGRYTPVIKRALIAPLPERLRQSVFRLKRRLLRD